MHAVLPVPPGVDVAGVFRYLRLRALPGIEAAGEREYARSLLLSHGPAVVRVSAAVAAGQASLDVEVAASSAADGDRAVALMRRLFDLGTDPREVDAVLARHPLFARLVSEVPGIRVPRAPDAAEKLVRAIVGQQISVAAARLALTEISVVGDPLPTPRFGVSRLFPTAEQIAGGGAALFRAPEARRRTLASVAAALADQSLRLDGSVEEVAAHLLAMRGIGPWTVGYLRLFALADCDVLLTGDSALRLGARELLGRPVDATELASIADAARPWRSYLGMHLWRLAVPALRGG